MNTQQQEFQKEQAHFAETLAIVLDEREKAEHDLGMEDGNDRFIQVVDDSSSEAVVQQFVTRAKLRSLHQLRLSEKNPYFARVDFIPAQGQAMLSRMKVGQKQAVYIGRWGIIKTPEYKVCVADWRSPVANLYYSGQLGPVHYDAPDGHVEGELTLKRMFTVEDGKLLAMQDTGLAAQEKYLMDALSQVTTSKLREVVTTIQAEQNLIIRYDPALPLCVQGVAGSGKTTIALHRIAWMLYRLQKTVSPQQMMIVAPNPLFLNYISRVLPDLGVEEVRQTTFQQLCASLLGKQMPKITESARLEERLSMTKTQRDALDDILRRKGALHLGAALDVFLDAFEKEAAPVGDVVFGNKILLTQGEVHDLFLRQLRHFPLRARVGEVRKVVTARLQKMAGELKATLLRLTDEKLGALLRLLPDGEERRTRATKLLASREERLAQLAAAQKGFLKSYDESWHSMDLLAMYGGFWQSLAEKDAEYLPLWEATKPMLAKKKAAAEDLPALLWMAERLYGLPHLDVRHIVIDEAQDVSPLQVKMLRRLAGHDAFTLVGDLWQGIYGDEGIRSWEDLCEGIFEARPHIATLSTSYRSTMEIMQVAFRIIARHPVAGITAAKPVLRHGQKPDFWALRSKVERTPAIVQAVQRWQKEGFFSMAIITKREADAKKLHQALLPSLPDARLVTRGDASFEGGIQVMGASVVKGLEFDCVFIADAEDAVYPDERFYAKLLYVLCTRPLHRLAMAGVCPKGAMMEDNEAAHAAYPCLPALLDTSDGLCYHQGGSACSA